MTEGEGRDGAGVRRDAFGPLPGPGSPYYVPPPSTPSLRRSAVVLAVLPLVLLWAVGMMVAARQWVALSVLTPFVVLVLWLRWRWYRRLFAELRRRRRSRAGSGAPPNPQP